MSALVQVGVGIVFGRYCMLTYGTASDQYADRNTGGGQNVTSFHQLFTVKINNSHTNELKRYL